VDGFIRMKWGEVIDFPCTWAVGAWLICQPTPTLAQSPYRRIASGSTTGVVFHSSLGHPVLSCRPFVTPARLGGLLTRRICAGFLEAIAYHHHHHSTRDHIQFAEGVCSPRVHHTTRSSENGIYQVRLLECAVEIGIDDFKGFHFTVV